MYRTSPHFMQVRRVIVPARASAKQSPPHGQTTGQKAVAWYPPPAGSVKRLRNSGMSFGSMIAPPPPPAPSRRDLPTPDAAGQAASPARGHSARSLLPKEYHDGDG